MHKYIYVRYNVKMYIVYAQHLMNDNESQMKELQLVNI